MKFSKLLDDFISDLPVVRKLSRTTIEDAEGNRDALMCSAFNPVRPILACAYMSGKIGLFTGKKHATPFRNWNVQIPFKSGNCITTIDWNVS